MARGSESSKAQNIAKISNPLRASVPAMLPSQKREMMLVEEEMPQVKPQLKPIKNYLHHKTHFKAATSVFM